MVYFPPDKARGSGEGSVTYVLRRGSEMNADDESTRQKRYLSFPQRCSNLARTLHGYSTVVQAFLKMRCVQIFDDSRHILLKYIRERLILQGRHICEWIVLLKALDFSVVEYLQS